MRTPIAWILVIAISLVAFSHAAQAAPVQGCAALWNGDAVSDRDCDGVPDANDNCPLAANAQQQDLDRNGMGDACDPLAEQVVIEPDSHIRQGEFAHVTLRARNARDGPIGDVTISIAQRALGINETQAIALVPAGEAASADFWLRVPACAAPGAYALAISSSLREPYTGDVVREMREATLTVEKGTACGNATGPLGATVISVLGETGIDRGENVVVPIAIANKGDEQATYQVSVDDLSGWGSWRMEGTLYLYLSTGDMTPPGPRTIAISIASGGARTEVPITVTVRALAAGAQQAGSIVLEAIAIGAIMVLIGIIGVLAVVQLNRRHMKGGKGTPPAGATLPPPPPQTPPEAREEHVAKALAHAKAPPEGPARPRAQAKPRKTVSVENAEPASIETYY